MALAIELKNRGHDAVVATAEVYRAKVEEEALEFAPVRPDVGELRNNEAFVRKLWHPTRGSEYLIRDYLLPAVRESYSDLLIASRNADLLITHIAAFGGPLVAEKLSLRWLSAVLQPSVFLSAEDPPALPPVTWLPKLRRFGRWPVSALLALGRALTRRWTGPIAALRREEGLRLERRPDLFSFSPHGNIGLFSRHFASMQVDWPQPLVLAGFPFYDRRGAAPNPAGAEFEGSDAGDEEKRLEAFLNDGPPPVLFTLGSSAVMEPGLFFEQSRLAAQETGRRAILLMGMDKANQRDWHSKNIHIGSYAPYSTVMPRCAAIVHQGGVGTTAQALRAGKPMIIVPWSHDQPDNAQRIVRLGVGRTISRHSYTAGRIARELKQLLDDNATVARAAALGTEIAREDGVRIACDTIEETLRSLSVPFSPGGVPS
jgi:rhamnosyltransferase subunit B